MRANKSDGRHPKRSSKKGDGDRQLSGQHNGEVKSAGHSTNEDDRRDQPKLQSGGNGKFSGLQGEFNVDIRSLKRDKTVTDDVHELKRDKTVTDDVQDLKHDKTVTDDVQDLKRDKTVTDDVQDPKRDKTVTDDVQDLECDETAFYDSGNKHSKSHVDHPNASGGGAVSAGLHNKDEMDGNLRRQFTQNQCVKQKNNLCEQSHFRCLSGEDDSYDEQTHEDYSNHVHKQKNQRRLLLDTKDGLFDRRYGEFVRGSDAVNAYRPRYMQSIEINESNGRHNQSDSYTTNDKLEQSSCVHKRFDSPLTYSEVVKGYSKNNIQKSTPVQSVNANAKPKLLRQVPTKKLPNKICLQKIANYHNTTVLKIFKRLIWWTLMLDVDVKLFR